MAVNSCNAFDEVTAWNSMSKKGENNNSDLIQLSSRVTTTAGPSANKFLLDEAEKCGSPTFANKINSNVEL